MSVADSLRRRVIPRAIVTLSTVRAPRRAAARARRALGRRGRVELFVAFDDASSAIALLGVAERVRSRAVELVVEPVVARGIDGDPAVEAKRAYAVVDARRLARRSGLELSRGTAPAPAATAEAARWATALQGDARTAFCVDAMRLLWFESDGPVPSLEPVWRKHSSGPPPPGAGPLAAERKMRRRRLYDTPVAVVAGQWFFAHERLEAIEHHLDDLGWVVQA